MYAVQTAVNGGSELLIFVGERLNHVHGHQHVGGLDVGQELFYAL